MKNNTVILSIVAIIALFAGLYGVYKLVGGGPDETLIKQIKEERPTQRTMWNRQAKHTLAVFSDHQCPACKVYHDYLAAFENEKDPNNAITKNVAYTFRYFPLYQIHEHAFQLAYAAEAAARQNKFKEMTTRFFADQATFTGMKDSKAYVMKVAKDLKLDETKFQKDMNDGALQSAVQNDLAFGEKLGVNATPTFYLDGEKLESMSPADLAQLLKKLN